MAFRVMDALHCHGLQSFHVVAGMSGLNRRIGSVEIMDAEFDVDGLLAKYESGKYFVRYATELTELAGGQKLVRLYDPSGNLIEVRTPFMCN